MRNYKKLTILKICIGTWENASRDLRELSVCQELGMQIIVMAKVRANENPSKEFINGFEVRRISARPLGNRVPDGINRLLSLFTWARYAQTISPEIISGHDLAGLVIGWLSSIFIFGKHKPKLVYDSHELELGRAANRSRFTLWLIRHLEYFLLKRCAFSIMVNDSIADEIQRIHKRIERPVVVRNIPVKWTLDKKEIAKIRAMFCEKLNVPPDTFIMMYHGAITTNRGIEKMLEVLTMINDAVAVILGFWEDEYFKKLVSLTNALGIQKRVLFVPSVSINDLYKYVGAADVGMIIIPDIFKNDYYMLPNKLFENIQSLTPVICSDFVEIGKIVKKYDIGLMVDHSNTDEIVKVVKYVKISKSLYGHFKENLIKAKDELCWENEKDLLKGKYEKLLVTINHDKT